MRKLLLDTNIYGELVVDPHISKFRDLLITSKGIVVFGSKIVRQELRATPKKIKIEGSNLRIDLLSLYDFLVKERTVDLNKEIESLAQSYYATYRELGGSWGYKEMQNDLLIVATASIKQMDIVVSNDEATMQSEQALRTYTLVNSIKQIKNPLFINYEEFKKLLKR